MTKPHQYADLFPDTSAYQDLMAMPHPKAPGHYPMGQHDRAMQFAPFAALTGYHKLISDINERYQRKEYQTNGQIRRIQAQLTLLKPHLPQTIKLEYFNQTVGFYEVFQGELIKIDEAKHRLIFADKTSLIIPNLRKIILEN